jgi:creatine kinase
MGEHADLLDHAEEKTEKSGFPEWTDKHKCLVKKHMTKDMYERLKAKGKTSKGFDIDYAIKAGVILPHVGVGIVNDGVESLNL